MLTGFNFKSVLYLVWLGVCFGNIIFTEDKEPDVKQVNLLIESGEDIEDEEVSQ